MIPKTNIEKQLTELSASLCPITAQACTWAEKTSFLIGVFYHEENSTACNAPTLGNHLAKAHLPILPNVLHVKEN